MNAKRERKRMEKGRERGSSVGGGRGREGEVDIRIFLPFFAYLL